MYKIDGDKEILYQWDINQRIIVLDEMINEVHFSNRNYEEAFVVDVYEENGTRYANIPNILLQDDWVIKVYLVCGDFVIDASSIVVIGRVKPAEYAYEETKIISFRELENRVDELDALIGDVSTLLDDINGEVI